MMYVIEAGTLCHNCGDPITGEEDGMPQIVKCDGHGQHVYHADCLEQAVVLHG